MSDQNDEELQQWLDELEIRCKPKLISRAKAMTLGLKRYFTGAPCKNGHIAERSVNSNYCIACNSERHRQRWAEDVEYREKVLARSREWMSQHRDEHNARHRKRRAERMRNDPEYRKNHNMQSREWAANNPEKARATRRAFQEHMKEEVRIAQEKGLVSRSQPIFDAYSDLRANHIAPTPGEKRTAMLQVLRDLRATKAGEE